MKSMRTAMLAAMMAAMAAMMGCASDLGESEADEEVASDSEALISHFVPGDDPVLGDPDFGDPDFGDPGLGDPELGDPYLGNGQPFSGDEGGFETNVTAKTCESSGGQVVEVCCLILCLCTYQRCQGGDKNGEVIINGSES
jgi:hypothetical protein